MDNYCLFCEHGPHRSAPCTTCGCKNWVNAGVAGARSATHLNNLLSQEIPTFKAILVDILELLVEAFPDAARKVDARREEYRAKMEEERVKNEQNTTTAADHAE